MVQKYKRKTTQTTRKRNDPKKTTRRKRRCNKKYIKKQIGGDFNETEKEVLREFLISKNLPPKAVIHIIKMLSPVSQQFSHVRDHFYTLLDDLDELGDVRDGNRGDVNAFIEGVQIYVEDNDNGGETDTEYD